MFPSPKSPGSFDPEDIRDIVLRAKQGDNEAFSRIYKTYFIPLYRYVYFRVGNKLEAEDLVQDVFLKAYEAFGRYNFSGTSPLAYFYTIARNTVIDHSKKKRPVIMEAEDMLLIPDDNARTPEEDAVREEEAGLLRQRVSSLPEDQQNVILARFIGGLSNSEVADMLHKSEEAVRQLQSRGLKALRNIYT